MEYHFGKNINQIGLILGYFIDFKIDENMKLKKKFFSNNGQYFITSINRTYRGLT